jgi:excisionase family DNA binding protein
MGRLCNSAGGERVSAPTEQPRRLGVPIKEAAQLLSCSTTTVYNELKRGTLSSYVLGRSRRVTLASIEALVASDTTS